MKKKKNPTLPYELIVEILLRLPVRSLLRFKCVCKSWLSLISDPQFAKSHFDLAAVPTHRMLTNFTTDDHKIKSLDFEASLHDDSALVNLNLPDTPQIGCADFPQALGSCRGFVLFLNWKHDLIVWNPSTGVRKRIPDLFYQRDHFLYGIGYDPSMDDYLVVSMHLIHPGAKLDYFSLKTNAWSRTQYIDVQYTPIISSGLFLNGALHWLVMSPLTKLCVIIVFDLMERSLSEIPLPHDLDMHMSRDCYLRAMGECLGLCYCGTSATMIWVMKEYKVHSSWTRSFVFCIGQIRISTLLPICITKRGEIFASNGFKTFMKLNGKGPGQLLEYHSYTRERNSSYLQHYHIYRESLLSLPSFSATETRMVSDLSNMKKKKMHQKKQKKKKNPTLPYELIVEILLRLPVRSLLRTKCVCKSWLSLISDPQFAKSHFDLAAVPTHRMLTNFTTDDHKIKSLDFEASLHDDSALVNLNLPDTPQIGCADFPQALGSCRGFVLFLNWKHDLIVWNPSTGVRKRIPDLFYQRDHFLYGIGYDPSMDDYLVVSMQLIHPGVKLDYFSLKTNAWSRTQYIDVQYTPIISSGLFLNGALHWLVMSPLTKLCVIIVFDLMERSLSEIPLPHDLDMHMSRDCYLRAMGECLGLCYCGTSATMIWVMKEYKVHSSWTRPFVFCIGQIRISTLLPICITKRGEIFASNGFKTFMKLNGKGPGQLLEYHSYTRERNSSYLQHYHIYRESLLSLPSFSATETRMVSDLSNMKKKKMHQKKKQKKKKKNPTLPYELIVEILLRLPVRSLLRTKCVCKSWLSLISDPQFAKSHFDLAAVPTHRMLTNFTTDDHKIKSLDFEASLHDDSALVNLNLPDPPPLIDCANFQRALGSCRGFVLFHNWKRDLIIWNPSTGVRKRIPDLFYQRGNFLYGIGYDPSMDDYLVVSMQLIHPGAKLDYFSLKTNAWSRTQYIDVQYTPIISSGLFLNGALHWLVMSPLTKLCVIIVFDLMERSLSEIPLPHDLDMHMSRDCYLRAMGECLGLCYCGTSATMIWVMKEYKVHSSWTRSFVFCIGQIHISTLLPVCITKRGEIFASNGFKTFMKLNGKGPGQLLEYHSYTRERNFGYLQHYHIYRESLLSLPSYSEEASKNDQQ